MAFSTYCSRHRSIAANTAHLSMQFAPVLLCGLPSHHHVSLMAANFDSLDEAANFSLFDFRGVLAGECSMKTDFLAALHLPPPTVQEQIYHEFRG